MAWPTQQGIFDAGDLTLQSGAVLRDARLSWKAHGTLAPARDNVIVYPTSYGAQHPDLEWLIGPDGVLDPTRWFIVICDMFGNGLSSSPSNTADYPSLVTIFDNVQVQRHALRDLVRHRACGVRVWLVDGRAAGLSLGRTVPRRGGPHRGELRRRAHRRAQPGVPARSDGDAGGGTGAHRRRPFLCRATRGQAGVRPHLCGLGAQSGFLPRGTASCLGAPDLETFLRTDWEDRFGARPAANQYAQLRTWDAADISANPLYGGDLPRALRAIRARVLLMPGETDLYFRVADNAAELPFLAHAELKPIPSIWGHRAGNPATNPEDARFVKEAVRDWLAR